MKQAQKEMLLREKKNKLVELQAKKAEIKKLKSEKKKEMPTDESRGIEESDALKTENDEDTAERGATRGAGAERKGSKLLRFPELRTSQCILKARASFRRF